MARQARETAAQRKAREAAESEKVDGVIVHKVVDPEKPGELQIAVSSAGDCTQLEWITLLEMGLKAARAQIGLTG